MELNKAFIDYYRCPECYVDVYVSGKLSEKIGYFRLGNGPIFYGRSCSFIPSNDLQGHIPDISKAIFIDDSSCFLPFDLTEVVDNLRNERYTKNSNLEKVFLKKSFRKAYYQLRPVLPVGFRRHLQKIALRDWDKLPFPNWPVDRTIEAIFQVVLKLILRSKDIDAIPFIWFWPNRNQSCLTITHDIETSSGRDFCSYLMDMETSFGIKSAFGIVPEGCYSVPESFLEAIRLNGCDIYIHGLHHDGSLFKNRGEFLRRVERLNIYASKYKTNGFRSPAMYRNLSWYSFLPFSYDMSVPNVGHLEAKRGGCCTVMPYFVENVLELPLTTTQDYWLYNILKKHSIDLWKQQINLIMSNYGLISFNIHPDYTNPLKHNKTYKTLLEYFKHLRSNRALWIALPKEIDLWWRQRNQLRLVQKDGKWRIQGKGKDRASIAYAMLDSGQLVYKIEETDR